jgi:hypothetical protein
MYCRATCPNRYNPDSAPWHQKDIPLGIYANITGIQKAEQEARKIGALLASRQFSWAPYLRRHQKQPLIGELIQEYKKAYFRRIFISPKSRASWRTNEWGHLKKLPQEQSLTKEILLEAIDKTNPARAERKKLCEALNRFVKFAKLEVSRWV